jgi:hypothetical protein
VKDEEENAIPEILLDYCFVRRNSEEDTVTISVMKDGFEGYPSLES